MSPDLGTLAHAALLLTAKATLLLGAGATAQALLGRGRSAAARHLGWTVVLAGLLLLPVATIALPAWPLGTGAPAVWRPIAPASETALASRAASAPASATHEARPAPPRTVRGTEPAGRADRSRAALAFALVGVYLAGVLTLLGRVAAEAFAVRRLARTCRAEHDADWRRALDAARTTLGVRRPVRLLRSTAPIPPMTWGIVRPTVLVPDAADAWSEERRRAVLLHELAHVARHDAVTQLVGVAARAVYWFHPGVWWAVRRLAVERERACDDRVLGAGLPARRYAGHLLEVARATRRTSLGAPLLALHAASTLEGRLRALVDPSRRRATPGVRAVAAWAAALVPVVALAGAAQPGGPSRSLTLVEELRIGGVAPDYAFGESVKVAAGRDGAVFVADVQERRPRVRRYDAAGRFLGAVGRSGTGPGEYRDVTAMVAMPRGGLAIYDVFSARISLYDARGAFVRSIPSRVSGVWTGNHDLRVDRDGNFYVFGVRAFRETPPLPAGVPAPPVDTTRPPNRFYLKLSPTGAVLDTIDIPDSRAPARRGFVVVTPEGYLSTFQNRQVFDLTPTGRLVWGYTGEYAFTVETGARPRRVRRDLAPVALLPAERAQWEARARFYDRTGPNSASSGVVVPTHKPAYRDLDVADDGRIWIHRHAVATERPVTRPRPADAPPPLTWLDVPTFDVFEPDGRFVGTVVGPENTRLLARRGAELWGVHVRAPGETFVVRYRMR